MTDSEQEIFDRGYQEGQRRMYLTMLHEALHGLGLSSPEWNVHRWAAERAEVVACLRSLCEDYGDNDWPDELHLRDVIEKHIVWPDLKS